MADQHDRIFQWLGLPPGKWPPDLYTLLGVSRGESDPRRIERAAEQRLNALRPYQVKYADLASEAMNAVASALMTLTAPGAGQQSAGAGEAAAPAPAPPPGPARPAGQPPTGRPPAPRSSAAPLPPILTGTLASSTLPPPAPPGSPVGTGGFPPAPPPRPSPGPTATVTVPPATTPAPGSPGSPIPPAPAPGTTSPGSVPSTPAGQGSGLPDPLRVQIVGPLPLPVDLAGMGGQGPAGMPLASPPWKTWTGGAAPVSGNRPGTLLPGSQLPQGRPAMASVLQNQPGQGLGLTGGAGGMPAPGTGWGAFNNSLGSATRNLTGLGKAAGGGEKTFEKTVDALSVFSGPVGDHLRSMFSGTISGAMAGYRMGGAPGAVAGAAAGFARDIPQLGAAANPQAGSTWEQTLDLAKTRIGGTLGADILLNQMSADLQKGLGMVGRDSWMRRQMQERGGAITKGLLPIALPGSGALLSAGGGISDWMEGKLSARPEKPGLQALPQIGGIGSAMGQSMSIEGFSQALGMSTMNMSQLELQKIQEQLLNMYETHGEALKTIAENTRNVRFIRPAFR